tara:strand:- start:6246 stop:7580 length:1335 start_codon:yes stop_codon:yes gene_type:complete
MKKKNPFLNLNNKIKKNKVKIAVIGLGYVGLPLAIAFALRKINVIGLDNDKKKIINIVNSKKIISSIDKSLLKKVIKKKLVVSNNFNLIEQCDVVIICVPTPIFLQNKTPNMKYVGEVIKQLSKYSLKDKLLILECTTYPGTTEEYLLPIIKKQKLLLGKNVFLGYSSEREDPGNKKFSVIKKNIPKLVSGSSKNCLLLVARVYSKIINKIHKVKNIKTAEFTKLLENIYRSVNIGLINEMKTISEKFDINIYDAIEAAKTKPFGFQPFYPGPGVGGHCIPVDPYFLTWKANQFGTKTKFIKLAGEINEARPKVVVQDLLGHFKKKNISNLNGLILGASYKKDSDDTRMSPSLEILRRLKLKLKKKLFVYDRFLDLNDEIYKKHKMVKLKNINPIFLRKFDFVLILTNHTGINYEYLRKHSKLIFDTKNTYRNHIYKFKNVIEI